MTRLRTRSARLAVLGWLLVLAGVVLPWTSNRTAGHRWLLELVEDDPDLVVLYLGALLALGLGAAMVVLGSPPFTVLLPAVAGSLTLLGVAVATPRNDSFWIGSDPSGRTIEGSDPTWLSLGAVTALVGGLVILVTGAAYAWSRRERP